MRDLTIALLGLAAIAVIITACYLMNPLGGFLMAGLVMFLAFCFFAWRYWA